MPEAIKTVGELAGTCGHDGTDWQKVGISASNRLQVETEASDGTDLKDVLDKLTEILTELNAKLETGDLGSDTTRYINTLLQQYTGSAWVKSNLLWGYNDRWLERSSDSNALAGTNSLYTAAVPAGYVYVVCAASAHNNVTNPTQISIIVTDGTLTPRLEEVSTPGIARAAVWSGMAILKEGDKVMGYFTGCVAGDDIYLEVCGYKMKIDM